MVGILDPNSYAGYAAEGKRLAVDLPEVTAMDAARFIAEATPIIGDAMAAKEVWDEATSENPNWALVGALGGATLLGLIPGVGDAAAKAVKAGARGLLDTAKRVEVDPNTMGSLLGNVRLKPKGDFDVTRKDASGTFGEGSERVRYTDPKSKSTMEIVVRPDGSASVLDLVVPEGSRGKGLGQSLQAQVMQDFPMMGGQVSSKAAATTAYRLGRRPVGQPDATINDVFAAIDDMSSVNLVSPDMQKKLAPSPAQEVSGLLASGRANEVTDEMLGKLTPNDNMELFELYESGATGMDLPMDTASRLARASEQEAAGDYYSGSNSAFSSFNENDSGIFASNSPSVADSYVDKAESIFSAETPTIYPLMVRGGADFPVVDAQGNFFTHIPSSGLPDELAMLGNSVGRKLNTDEIATYLAEKEFDGQGNLMSRPPGVIFQDLVDPGRMRFKKYEGETDAMAQERIKDSALPSDVINVSDPSRLRSKFARFDPRLAHLRDLSAGLTIIPGGLLALQEMQKRANEEQQRQGLLQ